MKTHIPLSTLFLAALMAFVAAPAQTPPLAFNYQALVRDGSGQPVRTQQVGVRIGLILDSATAGPVYVERHTPNTNNYGNINLAIGRGALVSGSASNLDLTRPLYINVAVDITGGTSYADLGTAQALSVPYAMYAGRSATGGDITSVNAGAGLTGGGTFDSVTLAADMTVVQRRVSSGCSAGQSIQSINLDGTVVCSSPAAGSEIRDADGNTRVSTERNPNENIIRFDLSGTEKMRLTGNRLEIVNIPGNSLYIGDSAGASTTAAFNMFVGYKAGRVNSTGNNNTFLGNAVGASNLNGNNNTFSGSNAGTSNTSGSRGTFTGQNAGTSNSSGVDNTFVGYTAGFTNTTGPYNTFVGSGAGHDNTTGNNNTFTGFGAGFSSTTGNSNTFSGASAGVFNTTGGLNTFVGHIAGYSNTTGYRNTSVGNSSGNANSTGYGNVFIGDQAGGFGSDTNKLYIDNSQTQVPLIFGDFAANALTINGTLTSTGVMTAPAYVTGSDRRLKENIQPVSNALDGVSRINGVYYSYKFNAPDGNPYPQGRQIGVIAQDVEKVYPELVATQPGGYKAVDYPKLTAVLIEAVKELKRENEELKISHAARLGKIEAAMKLAQAERDADKVANR